MPLNELLLHEKDRLELQNYIEKSATNLLLIAEEGFGKSTIADILAKLITTEKAGNTLTVRQEDGTSSITINQIRDLHKFFVLKTNSNSEFRVAIILDAHLLTIEAQNSLLKILEESPSNCRLILTSSSPSKILDTIKSRVQKLELRKPTEKNFIEYFEKHNIDNNSIAIGDRLPGLTIGLARNEQAELMCAIQNVKIILSANMSDRLKYVDKLSKNKIEAKLFLNALKIISNATLSSLTYSNRSSDKWTKLLKNVLVAENHISLNLSPKLVFTNLMLNI